MPKGCTATIALVVVTVALGVGAVASAATPTDSGEAGSMSDLIPRMSSGQAYSERYSFAVDIDGGGYIGINFTISNLGFRSGYGAFEVFIDLPGRKNYDNSDRVGRRDWTYGEEDFELDIDAASIEAVGDDAFELNYDGGDTEVSLRFQNRLPMWRPGASEIRKGDEYYRFMLVAAAADVEGRVKLDGEWSDIEGTRSGYGDHVATNIAPYNLATRFSRFRHADDEAFVMWREVALTEDFGGDTTAWVVVGVDDEIVFEDAGAQIDFDGVERDEETGYDVPGSVEVRAAQGDEKVRFSLQVDDVEGRDPLAGRGRAARMIAAAVSDPFQYNLRGPFGLELDVGGQRIRLDDSGHVTIDYIN